MAPIAVQCPTCGREIEWSASSPHRPFCSDRCRLIDLGAWLSEERAIPGPELPSADRERDDGAPNEPGAPPSPR